MSTTAVPSKTAWLSDAKCDKAVSSVAPSDDVLSDLPKVPQEFKQFVPFEAVDTVGWPPTSPK